MRAFFVSHTPRDYGFRGVLWCVLSWLGMVIEGLGSEANGLACLIRPPPWSI